MERPPEDKMAVEGKAWLDASPSPDGAEDAASRSSSQEDSLRDNWSSKWDYILSVIGLTIGLGNVWRFPYICYMNGGGAFLVPYLLMLVLVALPLFLLESAIGQFSSSSCIGIFSACPVFRGAGIAATIVNFLQTGYYTTLVAYPLLFIYHSLRRELPWTSCDNDWNTEHCTRTRADFVENKTENGTQAVVSSADEFFHNEVLKISSGVGEVGGLVWPVVGAVLFTWVIIFLANFKGVRVLGKVVWLTATFPYVMLTILLIRGVTLPGAWDGIYFYIYPNFDKLKQPKVWAAAAVQIFFSMTPGYGVLTTMSSHNKFRSSSMRTAKIVPIVCAMTSIFVGFVVFSVLGFMAHRLGTTVDKVTAAGSGLAFIIYPEALSLMPLAPLWCVLFFLMLFFVGIDSCFGVVESLLTVVTSEFPQIRSWRGCVTFVICSVIFLGNGIIYSQAGIYWLTLVDWYVSSFTATLNCLCELLVFSFIYGVGRTIRDLQMMTNKTVSYFWYATWLVITPVLTVAIFVNMVLNYGPASYDGRRLPDWAQGIGWLTAFASILAIPGYFVYFLAVHTKGSVAQRLAQGLSPTAAWGPAEEECRAHWERYCAQHPLRHRLLHPNSSRAALSLPEIVPLGRP
ncbi:sodium- and chloride-dependent glycine transporter 2-like [Penaeus monodon]|uniref:sodium- and chloride-dependent glycine transporter 2-like n=1 Tax=Penaeus monodon TaxID=6687 RepID=UPI0018A78449|nr:sodium- and chloride-dependent glycine transporter 2-like [Penaeus monodon]XP_037798607.1 sodium- and chloride-dependent glycine transporter 2-like [Penaeus monodon]